MALRNRKERHIFTTNVHGNPNVGLCGYATDEYCLIGAEFTEKQAEAIEKILKVPTHRISICGTSLIGVFVAGNSKCLLVPSLAFDYELEMLDKLGITYEAIDTTLTALGNNLLCNDSGCIANPDFSEKELTQIRKALGVPVKPGMISDLEIVGAMAAMNSAGGVISRDIESKEKEEVEKLLNITFSEGSVNIGSPQIKSGVFGNNKGFVVGDGCSGPEINNMDEAFGFLG